MAVAISALWTWKPIEPCSANGNVPIEPMVLTDGGPGTSTLVLYQQVYLTAFSYYDMGYASAMGYILGVIILIFIGLNYFVTMRKAGKRA